MPPIDLAATMAALRPYSFDDPARVEAWLQLAAATHQQLRDEWRAPGPTLEIGTWKGGTALGLLQVLDRVYPQHAPLLVTVDPYGGKPYDGGAEPGQRGRLALFGDPEYCIAKALLAGYGNHVHFALTSAEFFGRLSGTIIWRRGRRTRLEDYAFVLVDGDHDAGSIVSELTALEGLMHQAGVVVVDNVDADAMTIPMLRARYRERLQLHPAKFDQQWAVIRHIRRR